MSHFEISRAFATLLHHTYANMHVN